MQCEDIEGALVSEGLESLSEPARAHLAVCSSCRDSVADLRAIAQAARSLPPEVEPPARVWMSLRAQLEAEGLIRGTLPVPAPVRAPWWQPMAELFSHRLLAASLVGCLLLAAALLELRKPLPGPAQSSAPASAFVPVDDQLFNSSRTLNEQEQDLSNMIQASTSPVDTSLRQNLKDLDEFIAECEQHLKQSPNDQLAREYLAAAVQQKAELLSAMIDRGRSVN